MKVLVLKIIALGLMVAFTAPALAGDQAKADCEKSGGRWDSEFQDVQRGKRVLATPILRPNTRQFASHLYEARKRVAAEFTA